MDTTEERRLIGHVEHRLTTQFPHVPASEIRLLVAGLLQRYDGSRVRDFIPLLVEREARDLLSDPAFGEARTEVG